MMYIVFLMVVCITSSLQSMEDQKESFISDQKGGNCAVCIEELFKRKRVSYMNEDKGTEDEKAVYTDDVIILRCSHSYHQHCLNEWRLRKVNCPVCRDCLNSDPRYEKFGDRLYDVISSELIPVTIQEASVGVSCGVWSFLSHFYGSLNDEDSREIDPADFYSILFDQ